jgi:acetyltransferase-like isoleucine patch superfamily enzyme
MIKNILSKINIKSQYYFERFLILIKGSKIYLYIVKNIPIFRIFHETYNTQTPVKFSMWLTQKILGFNRNAYWPMHFTSQVGNIHNVYAGIETSPGYMPGCYIQSEGKIYIGDYTQIAANVGIITANHDFSDNRTHVEAKDVKIGSYCWIGMNAIVLPGVELGDFTIVGAGAVVTKSFSDGYCVIAGNPAKKIKELDYTQCIKHHSKHEYNGYIPHYKFEEFRQKRLDV